MTFKFPFAVEAIIFFTCSCNYSYETIQYEYIYQVVSEQHNYTANSSVEYCTVNQSTSAREHIVADEVSRWSMYANVAYYLTCALFSVLITSWSDKIGRKIAIAFPVFGTVIASAAQTVIIIYRLPLYWIVVVNLIYGTSGAYGALLNIGAAYLSDNIEAEHRDRRFTILDVAASLGGGAIQIATGYWIDSGGFISSSFFITGCAMIAIIFIPMMSPFNRRKRHEEPVNTETHSETDPLLPRSQNETDKDEFFDCSSKFLAANADDGNTEVKNSLTNDKNTKFDFFSQIKVVWKIYTTRQIVCNICQSGQVSQRQICFHGDNVRRERLWRIWFFVVSYAMYMFAVNGGESFRTMFFVSFPVCFTPGLVGLQNGLENGLVALDPIVLYLCKSLLHLSSQTILLTAIFTRLSSALMMSFAEGPPLVFAATSFGIIFNLSTPIIRSQISLLVSSSEQGSALALVSGIESLFNIFSPIVFLHIYPATLYISHGFAWIIETLILCIPLVLMMTIWIVDKRRVNTEHSSSVG
uniref:proton-coupled folate transporter-like n=1 Tax=Styela clava TaxID=7725 RepID=UPI001939BA7B|nr:proton-coupled folate transporter-like [Styela clava]XP_039249250.1 proton-coupled folate transporter-like [Styela clava]